jgi:spore germination protein
LIIYTVKPGDTVYYLSRRYGISSETIIRDNALNDPDLLVLGQTLVINNDVTPHRVRRGQSLFSIGMEYGISLEQMISANPQIDNPYMINIGENVNIPVAPEKLGTIEVNGYTFPNIQESVLNATLPFLTYLSIFSYQVMEDGSLRTIDDEPLIEAARQANVAPLMVITNLREEGGFSSDIAHAVLSNEDVQQTLLDNVVNVLDSKNYYGLDIDFEYIRPEDRENYDSFIQKAVDTLRPLGYTITSALAPKISADQPGLLYEAHNYPLHGSLLDHVILMTYEWGYTYGPPMAVAPIDQVRRVLDYAVTAIPPEKILMGMPNYGYDWTLPYRRGTAARSLSNTQAIDLAVSTGAEIQFDTTSRAPFFYYSDNDGRSHVVWFDDARSVQARLRLVDEYGLGGVSYWTINRYFPQNWLVLDSMYDIRKVL